MSNSKILNLTGAEFTRLANNFYITKNVIVDYSRIALDSELTNYISTHHLDIQKKYKVALCCICLNFPYWQYAKDMISGAKQFFLPGHDVDILFWSDIPHADDIKKFDEIENKIITDTQFKVSTKSLNVGLDQIQQETKAIIEKAKEDAKIINIHTIFPTEPIEWPMPTLMRYSLFLQQEEKLKEYDYIFYCDIDMKFVGVVGDEILGDGLTAAQHPMYALDKKFFPPYEPSESSSAFIKRPGRVITDDEGKPRFLPLYYAGGFQGGRAQEWIEAMKVMRTCIEDDFNKNYIAIWNDESHWNKYLFEKPPSVVLTPSYVYPDSLIKEYYEPIWGCSYQPKLVTLTKKFSLSQEAGKEVQKTIQRFKELKR